MYINSSSPSFIFIDPSEGLFFGKNVITFFLNAENLNNKMILLILRTKQSMVQTYTASEEAWILECLSDDGSYLDRIRSSSLNGMKKEAESGFISFVWGRSNTVWYQIFGRCV